MEKQEKLREMGVIPTSSTQTPSAQAQAGAALFYGVSSLLIMFVNKMVLTTYAFPSFNFLAASQFFFTTIILFSLNRAGKVSISEPSWEVVRVMAPLIFVSLGNVLSGLSGTKKINLPMFTVLRRFSILLTLLLERLMLNVHASEQVQLSVFLMIFGSFIAALSDLAFNLEGYLVIFLNNIFTALSGVITKRTVNNASITRMSVLFHSSWVSIIVMLGVFALRPQEVASVRDFPGWEKPEFIFIFILASLMGSILNYSTFLCTTLNSALTTTVVGCLKNVLTTYLGMIFMADYIFSWSNFVGLNISIGGSLLYSYAEFSGKQKKVQKQGGAPPARGGAEAGQSLKAKESGEAEGDGDDERQGLLPPPTQGYQVSTGSSRRHATEVCRDGPGVPNHRSSVQFPIELVQGSGKMLG